MPVRVIITEGNRADCKEALHLIQGINAENLLADRDYAALGIVSYAIAVGMKVVVIPPGKNRKEQSDYDRYL